MDEGKQRIHLPYLIYLLVVGRVGTYVILQEKNIEPHDKF